MTRALVILGLLASVFVASHAAAHTRSQSFTHWHLDGETIEVSFVVDARRVTQLAQLYSPNMDLVQLLETHVRETVLLFQGGRACDLVVNRSSGSGRAVIRVSGHFNCPDPISKTRVRATVTAFQAVSPTHIHIARIDYEGVISEFVLREGRAAFDLQLSKPTTDFRGFVTTGFLHVSSGIDHVLFLLAMILVARRVRIAILCITGFTVGHTLSLALATLGWVEPNEQLIEALIGLTIAVTALESAVQIGMHRRKAMFTFSVFILFVVLVPLADAHRVLPLGIALAIFVFATGQFSDSQADRLLPLITTAFGLVHGAGFAGGLKEALVIRSELMLPLLGFNVGVELAQLITLSVILTLMWLTRRLYEGELSAFRHGASALIFGMGCYWFAVRLWI